MTTQPCVKCDRPMIRTDHALPPNTVRAHARGRCKSCYDQLVRSRQKGTLKHGYRTGPLDEVVVDRVMSGDRLRMNQAEFDEVVRRFTRQGWSARMIASQLGCTDRSITRHRARIRAAA